MSLDGRLLSAADVLSRELAKAKLGDEMLLQVVRDGKLVAADVQMVDPATLATNLRKQKPAEEASVLGSFGSALSGLLNGNSKSKADSAKDEMAFDDDEPVQQVVFESEIEGDPPLSANVGTSARRSGDSDRDWRTPAASTAERIVGRLA